MNAQPEQLRTMRRTVAGVVQYLEYVRMCGARCECAAWTEDKNAAGKFDARDHAAVTEMYANRSAPRGR